MGEQGTRKVSKQPAHRIGGGEWELPPRKTDVAARTLLGGQGGGGGYRVLKDEAMDIAYEMKYAEHPILRLFARPEEMENGIYMSLSKEDVAHMNSASGKKLTYETLEVAMSLHERHTFHLAVATDGAKKGGNKCRGETYRLSETTYGVWQGAGLGRDTQNQREGSVGITKKARS
eukprot:4812946-Pleurochrysis_carterae.AAC.1